MKIIKEGSRKTYEVDRNLTEYVADIIEDIKRNGMKAVERYSKQFDNWSPDNFELSSEEIEKAIDLCDTQIIEDTDYCQNNVRKFAEAQKSKISSLEIEISPGIILGHKNIPVVTVGSYIPGGNYPMFGSAQMSIIPAKVAGVKNVIACTPPYGTTGGVYPPTINALKKAGADRVFILGGVQALAFLAFGFGIVPPADMLCGAGNRFIAEAKRQLFGQCGIDLLAGPTEIGIIADDGANEKLVAGDLLGQAEHDKNSSQILVCFSEKFAERVLIEIKKQLTSLETRDIAEFSWSENGKIYVAQDEAEAVEIMNDYAPEHLELHVENVEYYSNNVINYGSLFIGEETTVAYGDKCIGTNHILPTGRAARYTGGVWVGKFMKTVTYQRMSREASIKMANICKRQCYAEKMAGHAKSASMRIESFRN